MNEQLTFVNPGIETKLTVRFPEELQTKKIAHKNKTHAYIHTKTDSFTATWAKMVISIG